MQAIWKGSISFGMVTIPVKVYSATQEKDISFRQVHTADLGRIRYKRVCEIDGEEVPYSDIGKGYELPDGQLVLLTSEDFADLPLPTAKSIEVLEFVPADDVDPLYFSKAYYLAADGSGPKPYVLLRDALSSTGQCALVKVAIRTRESLALLRAQDGVLVLQTMLWPDEVRDGSFAAPDSDVEVRQQEVAMAESYISTLSATFDPGRYSSDYRRALEELVAAKTQGIQLKAPVDVSSSDGGQVVDLVAALRASVEAAKQRRGEAADGAASVASADTSAPKSSRAKQATAGKGGAKSAADRKTAASSPRAAKTAKTAKKTTRPAKTAAQSRKSA
jgi:DNA end-binding protein Ku